MCPSKPAQHRTILAVDVAGFCAGHRTDADREVVRAGLYRAVRASFARSGVGWSSCEHEDRGDGMFALVPPDIPKCRLTAQLPTQLLRMLRTHNSKHCTAGQIRLRMVVHAGEIRHDGHGVIGSALNLAFRLLNADVARAALAAAPGPLVVATSDWFFTNVVRHCHASMPADYRRVPLTVKETAAVAWLRLPST
jgi:class 3 adenylate cyclase